MLSPAIIAGCVLVTIAGSSVNSYTIGRAQEYSSGSYNPSGFTSLKDTQDHLQASNYATSSSPRYSSAYGGGQSSSTGYQEASQSSGYGGHSASADALNTLAASYQSDSAADVNPSYSSNQNIDYSSSSPHNSASGSGGFAGYGSQSTDGIEYASPSTATYSSSPQLNYSGGKASAYTSSHHGGQHTSPYSSNSNINYVSGGHSGASSAGVSSSYPGYSGSFSGLRHPSSSYPVEHSQNSFTDGHRFSPSTSLKSFMSSLHRESPASYHSATSHNPNYLHSAAPSASYQSKPGPYFSAGFPKGAGKIIIIKDGSGAHALMHPESSYPSGMLSAGASGYKVRSAGPFTSGHHYGSPSGSYSHQQGYSGASGHPGVGGSGSSYFGYS